MAPFNARTRQAFNSHTSDEWDAIFRVTINGESHAVFASYNGEGSYSQWGAPREALSANVPTVEAWAAALYENGRDAEDSGVDPATARRLADAGWTHDGAGWNKYGGITTAGGIPTGYSTEEALAHEFGES
jgi:hypothetical protein